MRRLLISVVEYVLGFMALALFAYIAFASGPQSDERFIRAFKAASLVAIVEVAVLLGRSSPANRLILGANLWLVLGGAAAYLEQWWLLRIYQHYGEASLFVTMLLVGAVATVWSPAGFIARLGVRRVVVQRSALLLLAVCAALALAIYFRGNVKLAAVLPVIALSWLNRLLRQRVPSEA